MNEHNQHLNDTILKHAPTRHWMIGGAAAATHPHSAPVCGRVCVSACRCGCVCAVLRHRFLPLVTTTMGVGLVMEGVIVHGEIIKGVEMSSEMLRW